MAQFKTYAKIHKMQRRIKDKYHGRKKARMEAEILPAELIHYEEETKKAILQKFFK